MVVRLVLSDGREVKASPGHPSADGKTLSEFRVGDSFDGAMVVSAENVTCEGAVTYDLLPAGATGLYRANGILLKSTLKGG
jgi:hypothetical protein